MARPPLRLVPDTRSPPRILTHRNRRGHVYYLHQGTTKKGAPKYFFAKSVGKGALAEMPQGFEVAESVNGVVSVRRSSGPTCVQASDVQLVRAAVAKEAHLSLHVVERKGDAIIIYEPEGGLGASASERERAQLAKELGVPRHRVDAVLARRPQRYAPVMKFEPASPVPGSGYVVARMTYRGNGGWMSLSMGPLEDLVHRMVPHLGRESFFELV